LVLWEEEMNERIKQMIDERGMFHQEELYELAEAVIRECMSMCQTAVGNTDYNTGRLHCLNNIKEHFGVK
jgi:hypothetical protein